MAPGVRTQVAARSRIQPAATIPLSSVTEFRMPLAPAEVIDLRSDTITRPSPEMRAVMAAAEVGDDVLGDDPTVIRLQERCADLLGKEAACYVPSGTMANLTAIRAQTQPGDEIIAHNESHFYFYETGGFAAVCGCSVRFVPGERGIFSPDVIDGALRPRAIHFANSALVVVENTHNRGGGSIWPVDKLEAVSRKARAAGLRVHMDGARLWNACVAAGKKPADYTRHVDTVSCCFSKGLGAPIGSIVAGDRDTIARAARFRKMFGGAMRQSGIAAAAALYALEHNLERLAEDHRNARAFADGLRGVPGISVDADHIDTNMVFFDVAPPLGAGAEFARRLESRGVRTIATAPQRIRAVMHLDVNASQVVRAASLIADEARAAPSSARVA